MGEPAVYGWVHQDSHNGVIFHRVREPLRAVRDLGYVHTFTGPALSNDVLEQCDTVVVQMLHDEQASRGWQELAAAGTHRLVIDVDDAMWAPDWTVFREHYTEAAVNRLLANVTVAQVVTTPNPVIAEYLARHNPNTWVVPNTVPAWVPDLGIARGIPQGHPTVGYQGSPSHLRDWTTSIRRGLARFSAETGWSVLFAGAGEVPDGWSADRTHATPWRMAGSPEYYSGLSMHVGVGPLRETYFNRCKSGLRAVEYAACGIVAVLPDVEIYRPFVRDGETGRLVKPHETLRGVLNELAETPSTLEMMSKAAREAARDWTTEAQAERWIMAWVSR